MHFNNIKMLHHTLFVFISVLFGTFLHQPTYAAFTTEGCGTSKGCLRLPTDCNPAVSSCTFFSWTYNTTSKQFNMQLSGGTGSGATYSAIAFGPLRKMENADLYYCTGSEIESGVIRTNQQQPTQLVFASEPGLAKISSGTNDGVAQCEFTRNASISKEISNGVNYAFDLSTQNYWILMADGSVNGGNIQYHNNRVFSASAVDLTSFVASTGGTSSVVKAHGALMILAWLTLASIGTMVARHFKPLWPDTKPGGKALWFQIHRTLMVTVFLATTTAFIIIFVYVSGYSSTAGAHAPIGIVVMALALLNPILALFRPHPNTPRRPIFNLTHTVVGLSARILGTVNIFLGVDLAALNLPEWDTYVLAGFVVFDVVMEILMEVLSWHYCHIDGYSKRKRDDGDHDNNQMSMEEPNVRVRGQEVKVFFLIFYVIGNIAYSIVFYVAIGNL